ncbi:Cytochrome P450 [Geosmithia morbida]|uniref:Cytochrome P450 n=1 Tax=Geosmithia morbida TaxID=1094350 RepID=A0A9P4YS03_9HYPO|nr:Cytochrome P450 [Geosmithia morbida]KAF4119939.1 Cytochrome P450 [Geosmithia morbida]
MAIAASDLLTLRSVMLTAIVESILAKKLLPGHLVEEESYFSTALMILSINYFIYVVFWTVAYPYLLNPLRSLPGPKSFISINHRYLLETRRAPGDLYIELADQYPGEDMILLTRFRCQVLLTTPRLLPDLLVHQAYEFIKPQRVTTFMRHIMGAGLVTVEGNEHKFLRKNMMPAFSFRHIKNLYPMMWKKAISLAEVMKEEVNILNAADNNGTIELLKWTNRATLDMIGIAGLGRNFQTLQLTEDPIIKVYEELLNPSREQLIFSLLTILLGYRVTRCLPLRTTNVFQKSIEILNSECIGMVQDKKKAIAEKDDGNFDVLSLLIKSAAGHETTSSSLVWTCYLLAKHIDIQERLREEVQRVTRTDDYTYEDADLAGVMEQLPLLNGVISETLRLFPTVPTTMREATADTHIGGQLIPKGAIIVVSMWLMNRSQHIWGPDSTEFKPKRWINKSDGRPNQTGGADSNYQFLTFLHGPRSCIGQSFARAELRCLLAVLVGTFRWELGMDDNLVKPRGVITIKPANGLHLRMSLVENLAE